MSEAPLLILLGAGAGTRMRGGDKLLEAVGGVPLLRVLAERGLAAGLAVRVGVPSLDHPRAAALEGLAARIVPVPNWADGMSASLKAALTDVTAPSVFVLPGDMPEITSEDLERIANCQGAIVQATTEDGVPGHPVRFDARFIPELQRLSGDVGARAVLKAHAAEVVRCALPGHHARTDLDTPEDWAAWRAGQTTQ